MAQRLDLHAVLVALPGVEHVYYQGRTGMEYPCIQYEPAPGNVKFADNVKYLFKKGYSVIVIDRDPDSLISDQVEGLPYTKFERFYRVNGLNHFVYQLFF